MRLNRLAPERLEIAREEYAKLVNTVVEELLGEYCSFEWVMYRASEPMEFWKRDLSADVIRQKLNRTIFYAENVTTENLTSWTLHGREKPPKIDS